MGSSLFKKIFICCTVIVLSAFLCRITQGIFSVVMFVVGMVSAATRRYGRAISCFALFPFLIVTNPYILPKTQVLATMLRFGPLVIGILLFVLAHKRSGHHRIPMGMLSIYLACACLSSLLGWCPIVSYMKLVNYIMFIVGIWIGTQNLHHHPRDFEQLRIFFLSLVVIIVFGSLATLPFPAVAYPMDITAINIAKDYGLDAASEYLRTREGQMSLFAGITFHSQTLAPILACCFALTLADMLFVECRVTLFHSSLLGLIPVFLFMTRSRTGLLALVAGTFMVLVYASKTVELSMEMKRRISRISVLGIMCLVIAAIGVEVSGQTFSRWLRKTDNLAGDQRGIQEAVTSSRMGLYQNSLDDFNRNPFLGMGFQVDYNTQAQYKNNGGGLILSAPIEKGLLPMMILGEGGVLGSIAFILFLIAFYVTCNRRRLVVTASLFTVLLATNIGEATFFSPGGAGGIMWILSVVGGFVIDTSIIYRRRLQESIITFGN